MRAAVVGAGLAAAEVLARGGATVTVYDRMPSVARKFLLAGRGGLNLTHSEPLEPFLKRYREGAPRLRAAIEAFPPDALCAWAEELGQPTFVGSSGRVFPKALKASPLLRAWLRRLAGLGVTFALRRRWTGWDAQGRLVFQTPDGEDAAAADVTVLALGGASWPRLGSDGAWSEVLMRSGVAVAPLVPANCGFAVAWSAHFAGRFEGQPLKRIALSSDGVSVRGEAMVTRAGLEGGAIYALSAPLRDAIIAKGTARLTTDLRPDLSAAQLAARLAAPRGGQSLSNFLRKAAGLSPVAIGLLHEAHLGGPPLANLPPPALAEAIKAVRIELTAVAPIARAISSAGGVSFDAIDAHFMLRERPGVFVAGEMLDWEAPTGGYLLQACFATGIAAAHGALAWAAYRNSSTSVEARHRPPLP